MVFVQCAGQRDDTGKHLPYCSGFCCNASIKQAMYFKDANPDVDTIVIYTDLRTPGNGEDFYRSGQNKGVIFTKGKVAEVVPNGDTSTVKFHDLILDDRSRHRRRRSGGAGNRPGGEFGRQHRRSGRRSDGSAGRRRAQG